MSRFKMRTRSSSSRVPSVGPKFTEQFQEFAPRAWWTYTTGTDMKSWARKHALHFWRNVSKETSFVVVYNAFLSFCKASLNSETSEPVVRRHQKNSLERDTDLVNAIVPEGRQTAAEERFAKSELNRTLYREYNNWYEAFEAEAEEDPHDGTTGVIRFMRHCAKILGRRTGIRDDVLEAVVGAWLLQHHGLCPNMLEPEGDDSWRISPCPGRA